VLRIEGLDEAIDRLDKLSRGQWVKRPLAEYGRAVQAASAPYVTAPANSSYRRTGTLGHNWYTTQRESQVEIGNRAPYSGWVQQRATQAWMHRQHGWHTVEDRAEASKQKLVFIRAVHREVENMFRG